MGDSVVDLAKHPHLPRGTTIRGRGRALIAGRMGRPWQTLMQMRRLRDVPRLPKDEGSKYKFWS